MGRSARRFDTILPGLEDLPPGFDPSRPISVTFIPASVFNNPALLQVNPEYVSCLRSLPLLESERRLRGNRKIRRAARLYFKREWCAVVDEVPAELDHIVSLPQKGPSSTTPIGRSASNSAAIEVAATGSWTWCAGASIRATSRNCYSIPPRKTARGSASGSARIRAGR